MLREFFKKISEFFSEKARIRRFYFVFYITNFIIITLVSVVLLALIIPEINSTNRKIVFQKYLNETRAEAVTVQSNVNKYVLLIKNLHRTFSKYNQIPENQRRRFYSTYLKEIILSNPEINSVFTLWKPESFDTLETIDTILGTRIKGQFGYWLYRSGNIFDSLTITLQNFSLLYEYAGKLRKAYPSDYIIVAPLKEYSSQLSDTLFLARFIAPVKDTNNVIEGIVGFDIPVSELLNQLSPGELVRISVLDKNLKYIYHPNKTFIGLKITTFYPKLVQSKLVKAIESGSSYFSLGDFFGKKAFVFVYPIKISVTNHWALVKTLPDTIFGKFYSRFINLFIIIFVLFVLLTTIAIFIVLQQIFHTQVKNFEILVQEIYHGNPELDIQSQLFKFVEFKNIQNYLQKLINKTKSQIEFTNELIKGNYDLKPLPKASDKDLLTDALNQLAQHLRKTREEQDRLRRQQETETWKSLGLAKINEILRQYINDLENLAYETIKELTEYVNGQVGAFFYYVQNPDGEDYLELIGYYGYNRKIYEKRKLPLGEGLSGAVALEKQPVISKVPDEYVELATGLGKAKPNYIAVYPLITNDVLYGTIEIAKIERFEQHQIEFLNEISVVIASSLASAKISVETQKLLEQSRNATLQMQQKQQELEKTIEQLERLRQQTENQRNKLQAIVNALNKIVYYIEFSLDTKVITINKLLLNTLRLSYAEATAKNYFDLFQISIDQLDTHRNYWEQVKSGKTVQYELRADLQDKTIWIKAVLVPIFIHNEIDRILFIGIDITSLKQQQQTIEKTVMELKEKEEETKLLKDEIEQNYTEIEDLSMQVKDREEQIQKLQEQIEQLKVMHQTLSNEFEKRIKRHRSREAQLQQEIEQLRKELEKYKRGQK